MTVKSIGLPAVLLEDSSGRLLQRFLGELGVTVVPLAEAAIEEASTRASDRRLPHPPDREACGAGA